MYCEHRFKHSLYYATFRSCTQDYLVGGWCTKTGSLELTEVLPGATSGGPGQDHSLLSSEEMRAALRLILAVTLSIATGGQTIVFINSLI